MGEEKRRVYLVGPCRLQNELMALLIQERTGIRCAVTELPLVPGALHLDFASPKSLILCDCQGPWLEELAELYAFKSGEDPRRTYLALFNLRPDAELERPARDLGVRGFFYKDDSADTLIKGVKAIFEGEFWDSRCLSPEKFPPPARRTEPLERKPL
ncbi:MAG: hypothetical protein R2940_00940 [Syntrophotaleaceae bacterium]